MILRKRQRQLGLWTTMSLSLLTTARRTKGFLPCCVEKVVGRRRTTAVLCAAARRRTQAASTREGPFLVGEIVEVEITSLTNLGYGVGRYEQADDSRSGIVILVPYVVPGEVVRCRVWRNHASHASADVVEVVSASPSRTEPACGLFGDCGGCQYQHMTLQTQREWKRRHVEEALGRLGEASVQVEATVGGSLGYGYRSKLTPHYDAPASDGDAGPIGFNTNRFKIVDVERCPIASEAINARLATLRTDVRRRVEEACEAYYSRRAGKKPRGATLLLRHHTNGVATAHDDVVSESVAGLTFQFRANDFWQNNPDALPHLVDHVVSEASQNRLATYLVDCYCGGGLFALAAASHFEQVVGLELSETSVASARANARENGIANAKFDAGDAEALFASVRHLPAERTAVILDPPRRGATPDFLSQLSDFAPRVVVYVSCDPATQARDAAHLLRAGYAIVRAVPFDLFPQTRHIESVLTFRHSSESSSHTRFGPELPPPSPQPTS